MSRAKNYLAIDLGGSSGRGIVGSFDGEKIRLREITRFANEPVMLSDRLYWDFLRLFHEAKNSIRRCVLEGELDSIGIDTWGVDYGLVDKQGRLMSNPVHYRDRRCDGITDYIKQEYGIDTDEIYSITGIQLMLQNTLFQLVSDNRWDPGILCRAGRVLFMPDLFNYFLTGVMVSEYTIASTGAIFPAGEDRLAHELLARLEIPSDLFPPVVKPANKLGTLLPSVQLDTGNTKAQVINVASHDTASAVISVPAVGTGDFIYISSGTWSLMGTELSGPLVSKDSCRLNFTNEGGAGGKIRFLKNIMGLWIVQESRRQWQREGREFSFSELEKMASEARPFACFINPDDQVFAPPGDMPRRIAEYCSKTGQYVPQTPGEIVRCIYESLALKYRMTMEQLCRLTGIKPAALNIVGGGSQAALLNRMTADACGLPVIAGPVEATATGNIAVQLIAAGEVRDYAEAREIIAASFPTTYFEPGDTEAWNEAYVKFENLTEGAGA
ncbi:MAG: rhamnulokinase [Clostridiales bacterium]|nr:rhamnulokinase [Clostridiales bacterium]